MTNPHPNLPPCRGKEQTFSSIFGWMICPLLSALQFLTVIPVPSPHNVNERHIGASVLFYPLVGLLIGAFLATLHWLLTGAPVLLTAALLLVMWILFTGGLHLDGLADSADAWVGGLGNRERTLAIMKDPCCGPMGVVALVAVLLVKFAALAALITTADGIALWVVPMLARAALPALFASTPYVRATGLGSPIAAHLPRRAVLIMLCAVLPAVPLWAGLHGFWILLCGIVVFTLLRAMMNARIGGTTGDTAGALVEVLETAMLVIAALT